MNVYTIYITKSKPVRYILKQFYMYGHYKRAFMINALWLYRTLLLCKVLGPSGNKFFGLFLSPGSPVLVEKNAACSRSTAITVKLVGIKVTIILPPTRLLEQSLLGPSLYGCLQHLNFTSAFNYINGLVSGVVSSSSPYASRDYVAHVCQ